MNPPQAAAQGRGDPRGGMGGVRHPRTFSGVAPDRVDVWLQRARVLAGGRKGWQVGRPGAAAQTVPGHTGLSNHQYEPLPTYLLLQTDPQSYRAGHFDKLTDRKRPCI